MHPTLHSLKAILAAVSAFVFATMLAGSAVAADLAPPVLQRAAVPQGPKPFYLRVGVTGVFTDPGIVTSIGGLPQPNGSATIATVPAAYLEAGYFVTRSFAVSISGGYPPVLTSTGAGSFGIFGVLHKATVGLPTATVHYHADLGALHPYVGGGLAYAIVFHDQPGAILAPALRNNFGFAVVGGADFDITDHWSLFFDVKKVWLKERFTGNAAVPTPFGVAVLPVVGRVRSDPVLASLGVGYRF